MATFHVDQPLRQLLLLARQQSFLTYRQVGGYLPDETYGTQKVDQLLSALDAMGIEIIDDPKSTRKVREEVESGADDRARLLADASQYSSDPIRMYLSQMAEIPLLDRDEEIAMAKKIELTRKRFRRNVFRSLHALETAVKILERVERGELPFDRTIKVSLTEQLTKTQVQARMPINLPTLKALIKLQRADFALLLTKSLVGAERQRVRQRYLRRREKLLVLVEELSLRTRRVEPLARE